MLLPFKVSDDEDLTDLAAATFASGFSTGLVGDAARLDAAEAAALEAAEAAEDAAAATVGSGG